MDDLRAAGRWAPTGPPVRRVAVGAAIRLEQARAGCGARCPWLSGVFAPTQKQHKPGARAKINTEVTRTKRHSPACVGTRSTMAASENLGISPVQEMFPSLYSRSAGV